MVQLLPLKVFTFTLIIIHCKIMKEDPSSNIFIANDLPDLFYTFAAYSFIHVMHIKYTFTTRYFNGCLSVKPSLKMGDPLLKEMEFFTSSKPPVKV